MSKLRSRAAMVIAVLAGRVRRAPRRNWAVVMELGGGGLLGAGAGMIYPAAGVIVFGAFLLAYGLLVFDVES